MSEKFFYMHHRTTPDLQDFTESLVKILYGPKLTLSWRTPQDHLSYRYLRDCLGEDRVARHIRNRMMGHTMALLHDDYPYQAIMPLGGDLERAGGGLSHLNLWSTDDTLLTPPNINMVVDMNFPGLSSLIFLHDKATTRSVRTIEHAHIIVDVEFGKSIISRRYFDRIDFSV